MFIEPLKSTRQKSIKLKTILSLNLDVEIFVLSVIFFITIIIF